MRRAARPFLIGIAPVLGVVAALALAPAGGASETTRGTAPCPGNEDATTITQKTYTGSNQPDTIQSSGKPTTVYGKGGDDVICTQNDEDKLVGGKGGDELWAEGGDDKLVGGKGSDIMHGGDDTDTCKGGPGPDLADECE